MYFVLKFNLSDDIGIVSHYPYKNKTCPYYRALLKRSCLTINCFVFEESIVFHKAAVQNIYIVYYFKTLSMCIFNTVKMQSGVRFIVDTL